MKRRIALSFALALSVLVSLVSLPATAQEQQRQRFRTDTGFIALGQNQVLRMTAGAWDVDNDGIIAGDARISFSKVEYIQASCNGDVCKHTVSPVYSDPAYADPARVTLKPGEAASMDITPMPGSSGVRVVIVSNRRNVRVTAAIINTLTGETITMVHGLNCPLW